MRRFASVVLCGALLLINARIDYGAAQTPGGSTPVGVPSLAPLIERVAPAVVNIAVLSRSPMEDNPLLRDPFFRRFFEQPGPRQQQPPPQMSAGSGVIVDAKKGYVVTNHHVIEGASEVTVTLRDRRTFKAKIIGSDSNTDIGLLQIEPERLTALPFGDSGSLNVGDYVVAIGNPFGLGGSVTFGIVSGLGRTGLSAENYEDFIQTDASVNPGNSGGGLINLKGELMGINTAILAPSGGNIGIGFAVPSNMTLTVMEQLIGYGEVRRGRLGFGIQDLTPDLAATLGLPPDSRGAVVTQVEPGSPADKAGIRPRDVVVAVNGRPLRGASDLRNHVGLARVGEELELTLLRDGQQGTARARVGGTNSMASGDTGRMERDANRLQPALAGATVRDIAPGMPMHGKIEGVVVVEVEPASPAAARGLRPGDVIVAINRNPVRNVAEFSAALGPGTRRTLTLDVMRGDQPLFLVIA